MLAVLLPGGAGELWFRPLGLVCWGCVFPLLVCVGYGYVGLWASALCGGATYRRRPPGVIDGGASGQLTPFPRRRGLSPSFTLLLSVGRNIMVMERGKGHPGGDSLLQQLPSDAIQKGTIGTAAVPMNPNATPVAAWRRLNSCGWESVSAFGLFMCQPYPRVCLGVRSVGSPCFTSI
jgi:hypothetical protein